MYKPFDKSAPLPKFKDCARNGGCDITEGLAVYYTDACPYNDYYINIVLKELAAQANKKLTIVKLDSKTAAQSHFVPHTLYSLFEDGKSVTQQVLSERSFRRFIRARSIAYIPCKHR
ncbi:YoaP domain-containing protein [Deferribacteres bacterium DY0037]|uniref:YoaP domain-containing protein n=1 Tax=Denitrovibrio acetiphilus TaxID=118000 RepID=UPI0003268DCE|nr:YoaP domain-containing protein [Denitrovibrio acetiphilus]